MDAWAIIAIGAALVMVLAGQQPSASFDHLFQKWGQVYGVDWRLLRAIAQAESSMRPRAQNPADPSYGLMGILCTSDCNTCGCNNHLYVDGWDEATPERLLDPDFNIRVGAQIIAWNMRTYGRERGIAAYNMWSARLTPDGAPFPNQSYVDNVLRNA